MIINHGEKESVVGRLPVEMSSNSSLLSIIKFYEDSKVSYTISTNGSELVFTASYGGQLRENSNKYQPDKFLHTTVKEINRVKLGPTIDGQNQSLLVEYREKYCMLRDQNGMFVYDSTYAKTDVDVDYTTVLWNGGTDNIGHKKVSFRVKNIILDNPNSIHYRHLYNPENTEHSPIPKFISIPNAFQPTFSDVFRNDQSLPFHNYGDITEGTLPVNVDPRLMLVDGYSIETSKKSGDYLYHTVETVSNDFQDRSREESHYDATNGLLYSVKSDIKNRNSLPPVIKGSKDKLNAYLQAKAAKKASPNS